MARAARHAANQAGFKTRTTRAWGAQTAPRSWTSFRNAHPCLAQPTQGGPTTERFASLSVAALCPTLTKERSILPDNPEGRAAAARNADLYPINTARQTRTTPPTATVAIARGQL